MTTKKERAELEALAEIERSNKVGRTTIQAGTSAALVTCIEFVAAYPGLDLNPWDPGTQAHFPPVLTGALFVLLAWAAARWMNRPISEPVGEPDA